MTSDQLDFVWLEVLIFNDTHFPDWRNTDWRILSNALAGEVGEICDATKHHHGDGTNPDFVNKVSKHDIATEAFDAFVYLVLLLEAMGCSREDFVAIARQKLKVLYERMRTVKP